MKGVTSEIIAEIRSRANLLEIVAETVALKRAGRAYKGLCPFHQEKTPSFNVNPEKGFYKCFGCGEGGDVFSFIQKVKRLEFIDAVRDLAERYGIRLVETPEDKERHDRRSLMLLLYQQAAEYYHRLLKDPQEGEIAREYLGKRGVGTEIIERFKLGYAPNTWDSLSRYLVSANKVTADTLEEAGLCRRRADSQSRFDLFRHRLMIPICDADGRVIAFGGRTLGDDQVKYLNSPETPIYSKGHNLFALNLAREAIRDKDAVIVVEGYFDAITLYQYGYTNTVAALGTALTGNQARLLMRFTESRRVYLAFDADDAGKKATDRGVETLNQIAEGIGIELRVIRVPGGKDPDECLRADGGKEAFDSALGQAPLLIEYQLEAAVQPFNLGTHTGRIDAARQIVPILSLIKNSVARGEYIRQWAAHLSVREEELLSDVGQHRRQNGVGVKPLGERALPKMAQAKAGYLEAERQLLSLYLTSREDYNQAAAALAHETFIDPAHQHIKASIEGIGSSFNNPEDLQYRLLERLAPEPEVTKVLVEVILKVEEMRKQNAPVEVILKEGRARILQEKLNQAKSRLRILLKAAHTEEQQLELGGKIVEIKKMETILLPGIKTEEDLSELKRRIDELLSGNGLLRGLETIA